MSKLQIRVTILVLAAALAALGVVSVVPDTAADVGTEVKSGTGRRVRDAEFLRHNYSTNLLPAKVVVGSEAESGMSRRVQDAEFLRHNYSTNLLPAKIAEGSEAESGMSRRVQDAEFLRHNYATPSSAAVLAAVGPPQTQSDPEPAGHRQNKR